MDNDTSGNAESSMVARAMLDFSTFKVEELKKRLQALGAKTSGNKAELISRLMRVDPSGERAKDFENQAAAIPGSVTTDMETTESASERLALQKELEISRREQELVRMELELVQRENELLRRMQRLEEEAQGEELERNQRIGVSSRAAMTVTAQASAMETTTRAPMAAATARAPMTAAVAQASTVRNARNNEVTPHLSVMSIAELLSNFDGRTDMYETWERQVIFLRNAYKLSDDVTKILIGSRLQGKALEFLHSKVEYITMPIDDLLMSLRNMFHHRLNIIQTRRQFEQRMWRRDETFSSYLHDKVILANRISIMEAELLEYIIEGIPDQALKDQVRVQRLTSREHLLEAFEGVTLRSRFHMSTHPRIEDKAKERKSEDHEKRDTMKPVKRCHNCGLRNHLAMECPVKNKGMKCFGCQEFGHIAAKCPKRNNEVKNSCNVSDFASKKFGKEIKIQSQKLTALIDTGSDLSLMRAEQYIKLGAPSLTRKEIKFRGIGSQSNTTLGEFDTLIEIDGHTFPIKIRVVPDSVMQYELLIGTDFLNGVQVIIKEGKIAIIKAETSEVEENKLPEIYKIDCVNDDQELDLSYIGDPKHRKVVSNLIDKYNPSKTCETNVKMNIIMKDNDPVFQNPRRLSPSERKEVNAHIESWLREGIIQPSLSDYASPVVLVKKNSGGTRLCIDYRQLNRKMLKVRYPLPLIEDQINALEGANIYSTLDLRNGFFHVPIEKESQKFTSFIVPDGQYEFLYVPFGLCNSPALFQKYINTIFSKLLKEKKILIYIDDFIIFSKDYETGLKVLKEVFCTAEPFGLQFNFKKCRFLQTKVEFLGHVIEDNTVRPIERKIEAVLKYPQPKNAKQLQSFLGLAGYFRKYVLNYSLIARPLTELLKSNVKFSFNEKERAAFTQLKTALCERPVLRLYNPSAPTELHTDASIHGYGAILLQRDSVTKKLYPIYYASGKTSTAETKYSSYELEVLAVVKSLKKFRVFLLGVPFKIVTDCRAFALTMAKKDLCVRVARWALLLEEFEYTIEHRSSSKMSHVDALSRNPLPSILLINENKDSMIARIRKAQQNDNMIQKIFQLAKDQRYNDYVVRNNLLYKETEGDIQLVLPKNMQFQIVRQIHEMGHFSVAKVEAVLKRDYWFSNMRPVIEKVIRNCISCILAERKHGKQEGKLHPIDKGSVPLDTFHIDHLGPLASTKKQYRHILVVVDSFSKFTWLYACRSTSSAEIITKLKKQANIFGNPRSVISDRGTGFTSLEFEQYCNEEYIQHILTTTGVPRSNGQVERVNRTILPLLTKLSAPNSSEWYKYLEVCQKYLNITPHRSIGMSPFNLLFGVNARVKEDPKIRELIEHEWISMFKEDRNELRVEAKRNIFKVQQENRKAYDKNRKEAKNYKENDLVAIKRTQHGPGLKLASKFLGPYQVMKRLRNDRYLVKKIGEVEGPLETSTSIDHMKSWKDIVDDSMSSESEEDEETNI